MHSDGCAELGTRRLFSRSFFLKVELKGAKLQVGLVTSQQLVYSQSGEKWILELFTAQTLRIDFRRHLAFSSLTL